MHSPEFRERVAIATGAGKGIGQATALAFASLGARVVLSGQTEKPLTETLGLIEKAGGTAVIVLGDKRPWAASPGLKKSPPPQPGCARRRHRTSRALLFR
jgi:NAD(P)-dependent dehydrogenase (short-subunit alcohol dehydrogenase family)